MISYGNDYKEIRQVIGIFEILWIAFIHTADATAAISAAAVDDEDDSRLHQCEMQTAPSTVPYERWRKICQTMIVS